MLCANNTMHFYWSWMLVYNFEYFWNIVNIMRLSGGYYYCWTNDNREKRAQGFKFPAQELKALCLGCRRHGYPVALVLKLLKIKFKISSWLNNNAMELL